MVSKSCCENNIGKRCYVTYKVRYKCEALFLQLLINILIISLMNMASRCEEMLSW